MTFYWWLGDGGWLLSRSAWRPCSSPRRWLRRTRQGPARRRDQSSTTRWRFRSRDVARLAAPRFLTGCSGSRRSRLRVPAPAPGLRAIENSSRGVDHAAASRCSRCLSLEHHRRQGPRAATDDGPVAAAGRCRTRGAWTRGAAGRAPHGAEPIVWGGAPSVAGSVVMELGVALPALAARAHEDQQALALIRQIPDRVVVLDDDVLHAARRSRSISTARCCSWRGQTCGGPSARARGRRSRPGCS